MPRDIAPLTGALEDATPGEQGDVYGLLVAWDQSVETALDHGGWSRSREIMNQHLEEVIDLVDAAAMDGGIDWAFLKECVDAYPPGVVVGESIHPDRLRRFDGSYRFDLERAADEYGDANDA